MNSKKYLSLLKKIYINNIMEQDLRFSVSKQTQQKILAEIPCPTDNIDRSYSQFLCQWRISRKNCWLYQIISCIIIFYKRYCTKHTTKNICDTELVCVLGGIDRARVPKSLISMYKKVEYCDYNNVDEIIKASDYKWFRSNIIERYPNNYFFQLKIFLKMIQYRYIIDSYHPKAIAVHNEYSCCSSAMTEFCHMNNILHINFMHGEKLWYIRDSFFCYDKCYIWHEQYKNTFISLKADPNQFVIEIPDEFVVSSVVKDEKIFDYCYYLANETHAELNHIFDLMAQLKKKGKSVKVRPHPRWGDKGYINKIASLHCIEIEPENIDIGTSIKSSVHVISLYSTVLFQAALAGASIVIDDLSNTDKFCKLEQLDYIAFSFKHSLLSDEILK